MQITETTIDKAEVVTEFKVERSEQAGQGQPPHIGENKRFRTKSKSLQMARSLHRAQAKENCQNSLDWR